MKNILFLILLANIPFHAQSLKTSIVELLDTNPGIQERLKNYNATKEDVTITQAGYYPTIDLSLGMGYEDTTKSNLENSIRDVSRSLSVYQNSLKLTQNIFNGFETTHQISQQKYKTLSAAYSYIEKVNDTSFEMVEAYIELLRNNELLKNTNENVNINKDILHKVTKLYDSGLTTLSEVNKIEASLALSQSNNVVQENTLLDASFNLHKVLGRHIDIEKMSKPELNITIPNAMEETIQFAIQNNPSILISNYNIKMASLAHKEKNAFLYPKIDIELSKSINNNLSATVGKIDTNRAMIFFKYNLFNGFADLAYKQKTISQLHQEVALKNNLRKQVIQELSLAWTANKKLQQQLQHLEKYLGFSLKTLMLYSKEYDLGHRSLLDLLSAQNDFIGAKSQIINTQYNILFAKYRILKAMGLLVSTITDIENSVYSKVNLASSKQNTQDNLPIHLDNDNDLIADDYDICDNSQLKDIKNIYGCKSNIEDNNILRVERYNGFTFEEKNDELSPEILYRMESLIHQLKPYGFKNIRLDILGNADYSNMTQEDLINLSRKRANTFRDLLLLEGFSNHNLTIYQNGDSAPISIGDSLKNNRVDIIVKKIKKEEK